MPELRFAWAYGNAAAPRPWAALIVAAALLCSSTAHADGWAERGVELGATYTADGRANVAGGVRRGRAYGGNLDLTLAVDAEKLLGWRGGRLFVYGLANHGESPSVNVGDAQVVSNIDAPAATKLYEGWLEQSLLEGRLSLRAGLYDLNSEFDAIETAGLFLNSSHGIGIDYSQSGMNGPSIFPTTSVAWRVWVQPSPETYVQGAVLDGVPGDPENPRGTHVHFDRGDGLLFSGELGYLRPRTEQARYAKLALGSWLYSARFEALPGSGESRSGRGNFGVYAFAEGEVYRETDEPAQGLSLFGRVGTANSRFNAIQYYAGAGLVYTGLLPGRDEDQLGFALAAAVSGARYRRSVRAEGARAERAEVNLELSYRMPLGRWLVLQPDLQYVIDPGLDPALANSLVLGLRVEIGL